WPGAARHGRARARTPTRRRDACRVTHLTRRKLGVAMTQANCRVGYVLKRYPRYSETFVVTEILAHEAAGLDVEIFALRSVQEAHFQDILGQVRAPVTRVPYRFSRPEMLWSLICQARDT